MSGGVGVHGHGGNLLANAASLSPCARMCADSYACACACVSIVFLVLSFAQCPPHCATECGALAISLSLPLSLSPSPPPSLSFSLLLQLSPWPSLSPCLSLSRFFLFELCAAYRCQVA